MLLKRTIFRSPRSVLIVSMVTALFVLLAACGGDDTEDVASDADPAPTEAVAQDEPTAEPAPTEEPADDAPAPTPTEEIAEPEPDPTPTEEPDEPTPEPAPDVDLAPELAGLTDWSNGEPVTLEDLRGEPVVLVFWNSI